jgi:glyoxylase I family protein
MTGKQMIIASRSSVEQAKKELAAAGMAPAEVEIRQGRTGPKYFFIKDPDGILVEISQDDRPFWKTA